ncbi:MAG: MBL fold metallo-hydrolase [Eubacteriaceae bacterium]|nr:MBL fold metallo-hydrolase [Eubacteriaceae bacterium]
MAKMHRLSANAIAKKTVQRYFNCIAHNSSDCNLLIGSRYTAVFDCGMQFCAEETIEMAKNALNGRTLDYIFLTHTHYDHIGALPYFKREWPNAKVAASEAGAAVLLKDTPRRVIRELSIVAAQANNAKIDYLYDDDIFKADIVLREGDETALGGATVAVLETPGHTRDALSFFVGELGLLIINETPGVLMPDSSIYPCYLSGYIDTINSIQKLQSVQYDQLSLPHTGIVSDAVSNGFFDRCLSNNKQCHSFIAQMGKDGLGEDEMLDRFYKRYASETLLEYQPLEAFYANAKATIACSLREASSENEL